MLILPQRSFDNLSTVSKQRVIKKDRPPTRPPNSMSLQEANQRLDGRTLHFALKLQPTENIAV